MKVRDFIREAMQLITNYERFGMEPFLTLDSKTIEEYIEKIEKYYIWSDRLDKEIDKNPNAYYSPWVEKGSYYVVLDVPELGEIALSKDGKVLKMFGFYIKSDGLIIGELQTVGLVRYAKIEYDPVFDENGNLQYINCETTIFEKTDLGDSPYDYIDIPANEKSSETLQFSSMDELRQYYAKLNQEMWNYHSDFMKNGRQSKK